MEQFAVVVPYYNEASYIADTLASLLAQSHPISQLILVDNASTDGSEAICRRVLANCGIPEVLYLHERRPGVIHALELGRGTCAPSSWHLPTPTLIIRPTIWPPVRGCFAAGAGRCVGVMAKDIYAPHDSWASLATRWFFTGLSKILPWHCFTGGAGQAFRTAAFRPRGDTRAPAGTTCCRIMRSSIVSTNLGRTVYHPDHWCIPSPRRSDRTDVSWTKTEQLLYFLTPAFGHDWLFHRFLARRFGERQMDQLKLREQTWRTTIPVAEASAAA